VQEVQSARGLLPLSNVILNFSLSSFKGGTMNWDTVKGNWKQMRGKLKQQWGKLTDDEFDQIEGNREQLVGKIQERYGIARDEADRQVRDWESRSG
jgi:uncharacterized protein YjbJ (UPF0337 family)